MNKTVFVLGMHRSGTSATAGVLALAGLDPGRTLVSAADHNPKGFYENRKIVDIQQKLLQDLNSEYFDIKTFKPNWLLGKRAEAAKKALRAVIEQEFIVDTLKLIKDPRTCRLFPLWTDGAIPIGDPAVVLVLRHPVEAARSLVTRDCVSLSHALALWLRYMLEAELYSRHLPRVVLHYPDLLADWEGELRKITTSLALDIAPLSPQARDKIKNFIDSDLKHHHFMPTVGPSAEAPELLMAWCHEAYMSLQNIEQPHSIVRLDEIRRAFDLSLERACYLKDQDNYILRKKRLSEEVIRRRDEELMRVYNSLSWRITHGLRLTKKLLSGLGFQSKGTVK